MPPEEGPAGGTGECDVVLLIDGMSPGASAMAGWFSLCVWTSTLVSFLPPRVDIVVVVVVVVVTTT